MDAFEGVLAVLTVPVIVRFRVASEPLSPSFVNATRDAHREVGNPICRMFGLIPIGAQLRYRLTVLHYQYY